MTFGEMSTPEDARVDLELELGDLRQLVRELASALNIWADACDDQELTDLIDRARRACK